MKWRPEWGKPEILLLSIQHNGTQFTRYLLLSALKQLPLEQIPARLDPADKLRYDHIEERSFEYYAELARETLTVVPLRHPAEVVRSWSWRYGVERRKDMFDRLPDRYDWLVNHIDKANPYYLPVDSEQRDAWLGALRVATGLDLVTDWAPLGHAQDRPDSQPVVPGERDLLDFIKTRYADFFNRFYEL